MKRRRALGNLAALAILAWTTAAPAAPGADVAAEVDRLLDYTAASGCAFLRNGTWHDAGAARDHLRDKYRFLAARGAVTTTEDFIDKAATRSSLTGRAYRVRCGGGVALDAAPWLREALRQLRRR